MTHHLSPFLRSAATALTLLAASAAQASTVYGLRDWLEDLNGVYAPQQAGNPWTFHDGSQAGSLFTTTGVSYGGPVSPQSIGALVDPGQLGCTAGFCGGAVVADTRATFAGTFVHTGSPSATAVVFHADQAMLLDEILLTSEMVQNAHNGNGMEVFARVFIGGVAHDLGQFTVTYGNTTTSALQTVYTPGLTLAAGDTVEIRYDPRGSYLYDHGNVDVRIATSAAATPPQDVPEPASLALVGLGLLAAFRPRRPAPA
ncbi:MAG: PEP-CTERM sorting domain-containing protein [Burkholderiales bacterium]|nr:PEP-CTERM sorting domain-containing protein [Burkholderiales bacterium]